MKKILPFVLASVMLVVIVAVAVIFRTPDATDEPKTATDKGYTYTAADGKATIIGTDDTVTGDVNIPNTLGGYPVKSIEGEAFKNNSDVTTIVFPSSLNNINLEEMPESMKLSQ